MGSVLADLVRSCAQGGIRRSRDEVERFAAAYSERIAALRHELKSAEAFVTTSLSTKNQGTIELLVAATRLESGLAGVQRVVTNTTRILNDRLGGLPDLLVAMVPNVSDATMSRVTQDDVCRKVEVAMRPLLLSISQGLIATAANADHRLREIEQGLTAFIAVVDRLRTRFGKR